MDMLLSNPKTVVRTMGKPSNVSLCIPESFVVAEGEEIAKFVECLSTTYPQHGNKDKMSGEHCRFYKIRKDSDLCLWSRYEHCTWLLKQIYGEGCESVFLQMCICLRMLIVLPASVASQECPFSKVIKAYVQSVIGVDRLNH